MREKRTRLVLAPLAHPASNPVSLILSGRTSSTLELIVSGPDLVALREAPARRRDAGLSPAVHPQCFKARVGDGMMH